jgi:two-component system phosphate regulon sensor histidine kinase PhoR
MFRCLVWPFILLILTLFLGCEVVLICLLPAEVRHTVVAVVGATSLIAAVAAVGLGARLARRLTAPVHDLIRAADKVGTAADPPHVYGAANHEIGVLVQSFNRMSLRLATHIAQLEEDRQQLRTILSGMVEGVVAFDADQRILFANDRAAQLLEFPTQGTVGRRLWELVRQRPLLDEVRQALDRPEPHREELGWNGKASRSLTVHAARLPGQPPRGAVLVLHDTSELRRLERLRQEFVANVSHELKTPLSVIKACVETLLDGAVEDALHRTRFLEQIAGQSERLHALILDLISLGRIESGEQIYHFQPVPVETVVLACLDRHRTRAEARQQVLTTVSSGPGNENSELAVWADEEAVDQILDNLLDNALKYTPEGGQIRVAWRVEESDVCLEVSDTGIGIPEADLPRIFERFYRVDKARARELGGTGLGLSIVKHLVQAMHGTISATSRVGQGTTFILRLPQAANA